MNCLNETSLARKRGFVKGIRVVKDIALVVSWKKPQAYGLCADRREGI